MILTEYAESPFIVDLSFDELITRLENSAASDAGWDGKHAQYLLAKVDQVRCSARVLII